MSKLNITTERVLELIDIYGAAPISWPTAEREAAQRLIAANPLAFTSALERAEALDEQLERSGFAIPKPSRNLSEAILSQAPEPKGIDKAGKKAWRRFLPSGLRLPAGAAIASLAVGMVAGYSYAGDYSFDAYLEAPAATIYDTELSFEGWIGDGEGGQ